MSHLLLTKTPDNESQELDKGFVRNVFSSNESGRELLDSILSASWKAVTPSFESSQKLVTSH